MNQKLTAALFALSLSLLPTLQPRAARASYIHEWTFAELAKSSEVLATAQVVSVQTLGRDETPTLQYPRLRRRAMLRVLRAVAAEGQAAKIQDVPTAGQVLALDFKSLDIANINGPISISMDSIDEVPGIAPGGIYVFPLRHAAQETAQDAAPEGAPIRGWRVLEGAGINLLTPALEQEPPRPLPTPGASPAFDLLRSELAGIFVHGNEAQILNATYRYNNSFWVGGSPLLKSFDLVEQNVHDEERWISIAAAGLIASSRTTPRVPLDALLEDMGRPEKQKKWSGSEQLQARVLAHVPHAGVERRLIKSVLRYNNASDREAAVLLLSDFAGEPEVRQAFEAGLAREDKNWIFAANWAVSEHSPLADVALAWANRQVASEKTPQALYDFCSIVRRWGSAADVRALAARIEQARLAKSPSYKRWLNACTSQGWMGLVQSQKPLPPSVWKRVLDDASDYQAGFPGWRWCDQAAVEIGRAASLSFSIQRDSELSKRDQAVAQARAWCAAHMDAN